MVETFIFSSLHQVFLSVTLPVTCTALVNEYYEDLFICLLLKNLETNQMFVLYFKP